MACRSGEGRRLKIRRNGGLLELSLVRLVRKERDCIISHGAAKFLKDPLKVLRGSKRDKEQKGSTSFFCFAIWNSKCRSASSMFPMPTEFTSVTRAPEMD